MWGCWLTPLAMLADGVTSTPILSLSVSVEVLACSGLSGGSSLPNHTHNTKKLVRNFPFRTPQIGRRDGFKCLSRVFPPQTGQMSDEQMAKLISQEAELIKHLTKGQCVLHTICFQ